jgi:hypothetical protein
MAYDMDWKKSACYPESSVKLCDVVYSVCSFVCKSLTDGN